SLMPPSRRAFPALASEEVRPDRTLETPLNIVVPQETRSAGERTTTRIVLFVLFICAVAAAFYAGRRYRGTIPYIDQSQPIAEAVATPTPTDDPAVRFGNARRLVDADPAGWLKGLVTQGVQNPLQSSDPEFLYLYGRASLLTGNNEEARQAFEAAIAKAALSPSPANSTLGKEAAFGLAAVALKSDKDRPAALQRFNDVMQSQTPSTTSPLGSPASSPRGSPLGLP
ncbi:MAG TPA: hypothetical protein VJU86_13315, partial [Pyrinomonadaceae bacterium]|nr:hypothetical protein [Pyrinomonadaceae bacterium]